MKVEATQAAKPVPLVTLLFAVGMLINVVRMAIGSQQYRLLGYLDNDFWRTLTSAVPVLLLAGALVLTLKGQQVRLAAVICTCAIALSVTGIATMLLYGRPLQSPEAYDAACERAFQRATAHGRVQTWAAQADLLIRLEAQDRDVRASGVAHENPLTDEQALLKARKLRAQLETDLATIESWHSQTRADFVGSGISARRADAWIERFTRVAGVQQYWPYAHQAGQQALQQLAELEARITAR